eukprot:CAMPEP_0173182588 /NCGR_PEP_ID=MMETSP1141-20130122/7927_1 /TAXON_ID=483371 /ORGANISM="non described non described, Strain CCMP2298" /LENGTH=297 /DNA_ID=CAMNT_0014105711 /DNA_START=32 /DNA_END=925 /DNA_ORIENTATION=-
MAVAFLRNTVLPLIATGLTQLLALPVVGEYLNYGLSFLASASRLGYGYWAAGGLSNCARPVKLLVIYQYEGCPFCRKVREAISVLALDVLVKPCPRETLKAYGHIDESRYRPEAEKIGGKVMFPLLLDPNVSEDFHLYESDAIVAHLWGTYGQGAQKPLLCKVAEALKGTLFLATLFRLLPHMGILRTPSLLPADHQPLELFSNEGNPMCRIVREALDSLELPYLLRSCPVGGPTAADNLPELRDLNSGRQLTGARSIVTYLHATYATGPVLQESWACYSTKGATAQHGTLAMSKEE